MSTVPYTFAGQSGNIPLSELDSNFSNVKLSVDYVIQNSQSNITSVGTLNGLSVNGNVLSTGMVSGAGNIIGGNLLITGNIVTTGTANVGNLLASSIISAVGTISAGNITGGNITGGNITGGIGTFACVSVSSNVVGANFRTSGLVSATGNITGGNITPTTTLTLPVFANVTVRDTAIPSPVVGMLVVVGTTFQGYNGTAWGNITLS
jgi:hypothetical protein